MAGPGETTLRARTRQRPRAFLCPGKGNPKAPSPPVPSFPALRRSRPEGTPPPRGATPPRRRTTSSETHRAPRAGKRGSRQRAGHAGCCSPRAAPPLQPFSAGPASCSAPGAGRARRWRDGAGQRRERVSGAAGRGREDSGSATPGTGGQAWGERGSPRGAGRGSGTVAAARPAPGENGPAASARLSRLSGTYGRRHRLGVRSCPGGTRRAPGRGLAAPPGVPWAGARSVRRDRGCSRAWPLSRARGRPGVT